MGIEPTRSAWKAEVLPLNYTCNYQVTLSALILYAIPTKNASLF